MSLNNELVNSGYAGFSAAVLAEGTAANTFKTTATFTYTNDGVFKSKAATDNLPFSSGHAAVPPSSICVFGVWVDAAGAVTTTQGVIVSSDNVRGPMPPVKPEHTLVGLIKVLTDSATTFTPNTTDLGAAGVTDTYFDCSVLPGEAK